MNVKKSCNILYSRFYAGAEANCIPEPAFNVSGETREDYNKSHHFKSWDLPHQGCQILKTIYLILDPYFVKYIPVDVQPGRR